MQYTLLIDCNDEKGLIYKISKILYKNDFNIESQQEFVDKENNKFFFRAVITGKIDKENLKEEILKEVSCANVRIYKKRKKRVFLLATKEAHALGDILIKQYSGDLDIEIIGVIANRNNLKDLVEKFNIPFYYVPAENLNRTEQENIMLQLLCQQIRII
nr:ACT domain-containing protein [Lebetimonas sp. JH369]